jgi:ABC-2 type transport system ATP-binding protein
MDAIAVNKLSKMYPVAVKSPGLKGTLQHLFNRQYREVRAVQEVSFAIAPGEIVGLLGPNGAGKTTTLKMLTGLVHPSSGEVSVAGYRPFRRQPQFLRQISLVMGQEQQLLWDLPAIDSLRINGVVYQIPDKVFQQRVGELSELLNLESKLTQPVRKLSLGERMKAELLAALLHHPQILFLDEPTLGLDINAQVAVRDFLRAYNERYGATLLLTSHYMADITALCDRVLLIHEGQLIYDGSLNGLLDRFAPYREVKVELQADYPLAKLQAYGEIENQEGRVVRYLVKRDVLTPTISQLLAQLEVTDLSVADPPLEEVIARLFATGVV